MAVSFHVDTSYVIYVYTPSRMDTHIPTKLFVCHVFRVTVLMNTVFEYVSVFQMSKHDIDQSFSESFAGEQELFLLANGL